jgi:hypothetical protein
MRKLVALMVAVSLLTPLAAARGAAAGCGSVSGNWTTIAGPRFPSGSQTITDLAIDARTPSRFFVTNGAAIMRTTDGGCSWDASYQLGDEDGATYSPSAARIVKLEAPDAGGSVLAAIAETVVNQTRPHIVVSKNAGGSWASGDAGLPPLGSPVELVVASSSPDIAYLALDLGGGTIDSIWGSTNGGTSWEPRQQHPGGEFAGFAVDPLVPTELWAWGEGLHRSTDGGQNFTPIAEFAGVVTGPVGVFHRSGDPSTIMTFVPASRTVQRSIDGGENWLENYGLTDPSSIAFGAVPESVMATSQGKAYAWVPTLYSWSDMRAPVGGLTDAQASTVAGTKFFFHNASSVAIYEGPTGGQIKPDNPDFVIGDISLLDPPAFAESEPPSLKPGSDVVKIPAGKKERVTYDLSLSKVRTPLDLYLLVDTSESAKPFLRDLAFALQDLVNELYAARLDVRFGMAEYRAYPDSEPPRPECENANLPLASGVDCERNFVYNQILDFPESSPQALAQAIEELEPIAGGHYNAPLPALQQTATGSGVDVWPAGTSDSHVDGNDVPPGQEASFREKALKIVLNATDEVFIDQQPYQNDRFPPDIPTAEEVIAALNARTSGPLDGGIDQIGIALGTAALGDLRTIAEGTGAVAPPEGADCNGDRVNEIASGEPLVCAYSGGFANQGSNLVPAIVNMVEAIRTRTPVALDVEARDGVVASVAPDVYEGVILQSDSALKFDVTYECPMEMAGKKTDVDLTARKGAEVLAKARATVVCGDVPEKKKKDFFSLFPFDRVLGIVPLLPLSPPPTLANPSQATQAQSQAQAQGAMATQEQEQPQLAMATQYKTALREALGKEDEYAMTRYRQRTDPELPPGMFLAGASLMMAAAYAFATSRRRRTSVARARR